MSDEGRLCTCGHNEFVHHGVYWFGSEKRSSEECEFYGFNELGGAMPTHDDGELCEFVTAGPFKLGDDGEWRNENGVTEEEFPWCKLDHKWVTHCYRFEAQDD